MARRILLAGLLAAAVQPAPAFVIEFDYRFDGGFFTGSNLGRRAVLADAASVFEAAITDDLLAIVPGGGNPAIARFTQPDTGMLANLTLTAAGADAVAADTVKVFAGARDLGGSTLGVGGPGSYLSIRGTQPFLDDTISRGEGDGTTTAVEGSFATDFALWGGSITFDTLDAGGAPRNWDFDASDGITGNDFYSVALHELAHLLGFGTSGSWTNWISGAVFTGPASVAAFGGSVPLDGIGAHWANGTSSFVNGVPQEAAMDPSLQVGRRKELTDLDFAALEDIGWEVRDPAAVPVPAPA